MQLISSRQCLTSASFCAPTIDYFFFFFQAEDGIRDGHVTGVQTCALPISPAPGGPRARRHLAAARGRAGPGRLRRDRKSTRLNSSHVAISYAVFFLKKIIDNRTSCSARN